MKTVMLSWRFACDIANYEKKANAMGYVETFIEAAGVSLVPMIKSTFMIDVAGEGTQEEITIMEVHPLICGSGPMSADEPEMEPERFGRASNDDSQGPTSRSPSSPYTDRSWTFLAKSDASF